MLVHLPNCEKVTAENVKCASLTKVVDKQYYIKESNDYALAL